MSIIQDNATLMAYIPNVVTAVEGEKDLYTKIVPHLTVAEAWFFRNVASEGAVTTDAAMLFARSIVACEAFKNAVPSLNVILTQNGFGIVSNQTTAPASKERTESLIEALTEQRDNAIEQLVFMLNGQHTRFAGTVFQVYEAQRMQGETKHLFDKFIEQRSAILRLQTALCNEVLSAEVLQQMVDNTYTDEASRSVAIEYLFSLVPDIIVRQLKGEDCKEDIRRVVDYIRTNPTAFPNWATSQAAKHWEDHTFKNDKKYGGYWL